MFLNGGIYDGMRTNKRYKNVSEGLIEAQAAAVFTRCGIVGSPLPLRPRKPTGATGTGEGCRRIASPLPNRAGKPIVASAAIFTRCGMDDASTGSVSPNPRSKRIILYLCSCQIEKLNILLVWGHCVVIRLSPPLFIAL